MTGYVVLGFFGRSLVGYSMGRVFFSSFFLFFSFLHDLDRAFRSVDWGESLFADPCLPCLSILVFFGPSCAVPWLPVDY